jgi:hypothetical protein
MSYGPRKREPIFRFSGRYAFQRPVIYLFRNPCLLVNSWLEAKGLPLKL